MRFLYLLMPSFICLILLLTLIHSDVTIWDRASLLNKQTILDIPKISQDIQKEKYPSLKFRGTSPSGSSVTLTVFDFRIKQVNFRKEFMEIGFPIDNNSTFTINMPLGFHAWVEFKWIASKGLISFSGDASFDGDIFDISTNLALQYDPVHGKINVVAKTLLKFAIPRTIQTHSIFNFDNIFKIRETMPEIIQFYNKRIVAEKFQNIIAQTIYDRYSNSLNRFSYEMKIFFPVFQEIYDEKIVLDNIQTTNNSLVFQYLKWDYPSLNLQDISVVRQYCYDNHMLNKLINFIWPNTSRQFTSGDLTIDEGFELTVSSISRIIPDLGIAYDDSTTLYLSFFPDNLDNLSFQMLNSTTILIDNLKSHFVFTLDKVATPVLTITILYQVFGEPEIMKSVNGYDLLLGLYGFNIDSVQISSPYSTVLMPNLYLAVDDYMNSLILPYLDFNLFGDGIHIEDELTMSCIGEPLILSNSICLNLREAIS